MINENETMNLTSSSMHLYYMNQFFDLALALAVTVTVTATLQE